MGNWGHVRLLHLGTSRYEHWWEKVVRVPRFFPRLSDALGKLAEARIKAAVADGDADLKSSEAASAAFNKMAQTVRRTLALEAKLAEGVKTRRDSLLAERAARRADRETAHEAAKTKAILYGFHDAYAGSSSDAEYDDLIERLMEDTEEYLGDADEFRGYLDRPVGETVAKLCAALGLDPDACALDDDSWRVRRAPTEFERLLDERARTFGKPPSSPSWGAREVRRSPASVSPPWPEGRG